MAEELQQENILVYALSAVESRIECASSGSFLCDTVIEKENVPPAIAVSANVTHDVDSDRQEH